METHPYDVLKLEHTGQVATITFNRPEKLNALSVQLTTEIHAALDEVAADLDIRALILTGTGRGFCSGNDVSNQLAALEGRRSGPEGPGIAELAPHIQSLPQPVIAAVNGVAAGAGLAIALASDIRIASEDARFSCIFVKRSSSPDTGTSYTLPRLVGHGIAMEMALTGNIYDAPWALKVGLVNRVVLAGQLMEEAREMAQAIAANPPVAVRAIKRLFYQHGHDLEKDVLPKERVTSAIATGSEDRGEAVRAFLEKRTPVYRGR